MTRPTHSLLMFIVAMLGCSSPRERETPSEREVAPALEPAPEPAQPATLRWMLGSDTHDLAVLERAHARLLARTSAITGVERLDDCAPRSHVIIELDPSRLHAYALAPDDIIAALQDVSGTELEAVRTRPIGPVTLGDLAGLRYGFADPECVAATAKGIAASATVRLANERAEAELGRLLDDFTQQLPPDLSLTVLGTGHAVVELSLVSDVSPEQGAELLGRHLVGLPAMWMVEVGLVGEPCAAGMRARLSMRGLDMPVTAVMERLQRIPGVAQVEQAGDASVQRLLLFEHDPQRVAGLADQLRALPGVARVDIALGRPTLHVEPDPSAIAAHGLTREQLMQQVQLLTDGVALGHVVAHGHDVPLLLRFGQRDASHPDELRTAMIHVGERQVPLAELAAINFDPAVPHPDCRHDGRAGLAVDVGVADAQQWPELRPRIEAVLPAGAWAWAP